MEATRKKGGATASLEEHPQGYLVAAQAGDSTAIGSAQEVTHVELAPSPVVFLLHQDTDYPLNIEPRKA